jgi:hypothetical protein
VDVPRAPKAAAESEVCPSEKGYRAWQTPSDGSKTIGGTMPKRDVELHALEDHEAVERAAEAMWNAEGGDHPHLTWAGLSDQSQTHWRRRARVALQSFRSSS